MLFDLFPILLFFGTFKFAEKSSETALNLLSYLGQGFDATTAPIILATSVAIAASIAQVLYLVIKRKPIEPMLWISLAIIVIFGGLTIWLKNEMFIKWKPTILYLIFASILVYGNLTGKNFLSILLKNAKLQLPAHAWKNIQNAWIVFFVLVAIANIAVAYTFSTDIWVNFKLFGLLGLTFAFTIAIGFYMAKFSDLTQDNSSH